MSSQLKQPTVDRAGIVSEKPDEHRDHRRDERRTICRRRKGRSGRLTPFIGVECESAKKGLPRTGGKASNSPQEASVQFILYRTVSVLGGVGMDGSGKRRKQKIVSASGYLDPGACNEFLVRLYFGPSEDYLKSCMTRAYLDFNRTLHGFGSRPNAEQTRYAAESLLENAFLRLCATPPVDMDSFDSWHRRTCGSIKRAFKAAGFPVFSIGQAQKWINMTMKYVFVLGESRLPGYGPALRFAHVPIDNIVLETWRDQGMPQPSVAWSRLDDYSEYVEMQEWARNRFAPATPLEAEFWAWIVARESRTDRIAR